MRDHIRFLLNDETVELKAVGANDTLLDFLRLERGLTGTKEGCGEGDCGACTVLVGRLKDDVLDYRAVNACIAFMGSLDGCHIVTIEALAQNGVLHPVQAAIADAHGAQCGFCTPGIVMSLYALWMKGADLSREDVEIALQGNLCRCTGYAPILRAMTSLTPFDHKNDPITQHRDDVNAKLQEMNDKAPIFVETDAPFFAPATLTQLEIALQDNPNARLVAGATDVGLWVTKRLKNISPAIFLSRIDALKAIDISDECVRIGALASYSNALEVLSKIFPHIHDYMLRIGGTQVRNQGTIGGNIANGSPIGDMPPALIAMDAKIILNHHGKRRQLALEDYFLDYGKQDIHAGEFLEAIEIPIKNEMNYQVFKLSKRPDEDISAVAGAMSYRCVDNRLHDVRIAFGGMAATPKRAKATEAVLEGAAFSEASFRQAMKALEDDFTPISDLRASAEYRMEMAKMMILRGYLEGGFQQEVSHDA